MWESANKLSTNTPVIGDALSNWPELYFLPHLRLNDSKSLMYPCGRGCVICSDFGDSFPIPALKLNIFAHGGNLCP